MWKQFVLVLIVTTAIVFVPGYLGARLSGGKRALSLAVAGPLSVVFYIVAGIVMYPLGLKGLVPLFAFVACFLAFIAAARFGSERVLHKKIRSSLSLSLPGACIVICLGALAASYVVCRGLGNPNNFLQYDDNYTHIAFINHTIQTGIFSTLKASVFDSLPLLTPQPFSGSWYYPLAFHSFASVVALLTHCSIGMAENAVNVVWTGLVYPLGLFALVSKIFGKKIRWHGIVKTLCFIAGISVIFLLIGFGAGLLGQIMYTNWFRYLMGALIIILGLHQMEVFHFHFLEKQKTVDFGANKHKNELFSAFLLGLGFSFGWTPCIGPVLGSVLALAASNGQDALMGALYLFIYTLGMAIPFLLLALASGIVLPYFNRLKPHLLLLKKIGGLIIIIMGILLLLGQLNSLSAIFS